jgi:hypothetical protein
MFLAGFLLNTTKYLQKSSIFAGRFLNSVLPITLKEWNDVGGTIGR